MSRRVCLISRDRKFSNQFSVQFSINNVNKQHGNHCGSVAIAVLRNNRGGRRQNINRHGCVNVSDYTSLVITSLVICSQSDMTRWEKQRRQFAVCTDEDVDNEEVYRMAVVMSQCGGLQIMLKRYLVCTTVDTRQSLVAELWWRLQEGQCNPRGFFINCIFFTEFYLTLYKRMIKKELFFL